MSNDWTSDGVSSGPPKLVLLGVAAVLVVGVVSSMALFNTSVVTAEPSVAIGGLDIQDPDSITSDTVTSLGVAYTTGSVSWENTPEPVETITYTWYVTGPDGQQEEAWTTTCESSADPSPAQCEFESTTSGSAPFETEFSILESTSWEGSDFVPPDGETKETEVDLYFEVQLFWNGGSESKTVSDSVVVTVTNPEDTGNNTTETATETATGDVAVSIDLSSSVYISGD